jgi:hypothetical protein
MLSCFIASLDCANAVKDIARKHTAINLQIVFFINPPQFVMEIAAAHPSRPNEMRFRQQGYRRFVNGVGYPEKQ